MPFQYLVIFVPIICFVSVSLLFVCTYSFSCLHIVLKNFLQIVHVLPLGLSCLISSKLDAHCLMLLSPFAIEGNTNTQIHHQQCINLIFFVLADNFYSNIFVLFALFLRLYNIGDNFYPFCLLLLVSILHPLCIHLLAFHKPH